MTIGCNEHIIPFRLKKERWSAHYELIWEIPVERYIKGKDLKGGVEAEVLQVAVENLPEFVERRYFA